MSTDAALTAVLPSARLHLSTSVLMAFVAALATWVPARGSRHQSASLPPSGRPGELAHH